MADFDTFGEKSEDNILSETENTEQTAEKESTAASAESCPQDPRPYGEAQRPQYAPPQNGGYRPQGTRPYSETRPQYTPPQPAESRPQYAASSVIAKKPGFVEKVIDFFVGPDVRPLGITAAFLGIALIMTILLQMGIPTLFFTPYLDNSLFFTAFVILTSSLCNALPFIGVYFILKRMGCYSAPLPFERPRKGSSVFLLIVAGLGLCYVGNIISGYIVMFFESIGMSSFAESQNIVSGLMEPTGIFESIVTVVGMACMPAIFEELVFRGIIMQPLRRYGDWFAIIVSSFVFALIHGNISQTPFAFIAGIALGYISIVSGSLWTSVILHFINNFLATINTFIIPVVSEEAFNAYSALSLYGIIFVGFAAFIALFVKNRSLLRLRKGDKGNVGFFRKNIVTYLSPTLFIGLSMYTVFLAVDLLLPFFVQTVLPAIMEAAQAYITESVA